MVNNFDIDALINQLVTTYLYKGVQPDELASALYEDEYEEFTIRKDKEKDLLIAQISFLEIENDITSIHKFKYSYTLSSNTLFKVEQAVNSGRFKVQWDREKSLTELKMLIAKKISPKDFLKRYGDKVPLEIKSQLYLVA